VSIVLQYDLECVDKLFKTPACSVGLCVARWPIYRVVCYIRVLPIACFIVVSRRSALVVIALFADYLSNKPNRIAAKGAECWHRC